MKKIVLNIMIASMLLVSVGMVVAKKDPMCTTIQSGELLDSTGNVISLGYDAWGYNYQAHMFNGLYDNYARPEVPVTEGDTWLMMKWNDAWLSNKDCDDDNLLDRHLGFDTYTDSGAWLTNHERGTYVNEEGETCKYEYFVKIITPDSDATVVDGIWYDSEGNEIGPVIWGAFAIIQEFMNDPCEGGHEVMYKSPSPLGLGFYA